MAVNLLEVAKRQKDLYKRGVIEVYANATELMQVLPFEDIEGMAVKYNQESMLPGIGFRGINEAYTESTGVINPVMDPLVIAGGDVDIDRFLLRTGGEGQREGQEAMKIKSLAHKWSDTFIKGDNTTDPRVFDGLQVRLGGSQLIANGATSGGDPLSLAKLDELIDAVDSPTHLIMNKTLARRLTAAARSTSVGGFVTWEKDEFGRRIMFYNDLPVVRMGANGEIYNTLDFVEAGSGGGSTASSVYCVSMGPGMLTGIQNSEIDVEDLGQLQTQPVERTRIEWYAGIAMYHPRAAARLSSVSNAAIVA